MNANENKKMMQVIFAEMAKGNTAPFRDSLADDISWRFMGSTNWTKTYRGKAAVLRDLLMPLMAQFSDAYSSSAQRLIAEDDLVVIETRGRATTLAGKPYNNQYCYICRIANGRIAEITEYMDTALADAVLAEPA